MNTTPSPWFLAITLAVLIFPRAETRVSQSATPQLYDPGKRVTVTGMLMGSAAPSPPQSVYLLIATRDAKGNEQHWAIEGDPIDELKKRGWKDDALTMGEELTVTGYPPRAGQRPQDRMSMPGRGRGALHMAFTVANEGRLMLGTEITRADGQKIPFGRMK